MMIPTIPTKTYWFTMLLPALCLFGQTVVFSQQSETSSRKEEHRYSDSIRPLLEHACYDCHSGDTVEGNFHADELDPNLATGADLAWWLEVYSVLSTGEMPPPESTELSDDQRKRIVVWLSTEIQAAEELRKNGGNQSSFRRLTRYEYNYALQDLLGAAWTFDSDLPLESSEDTAFENNATSLHMSGKQIETYHQLALAALNRVTVRGDQPRVVHWSIPMSVAFEREKKRHDKEIASLKKKFTDSPEALSKEIQRATQRFQSRPDQSHYIDMSSGLRAEIDWDYRRASYVVPPIDTFPSTPDVGSHFAVVQPGSRQSLTVELGDQLPDEGTMRVRIRASKALNSADQVPSLQLYFGFQATDQGRSIKRLSQQDMRIEAAFGKPEFYHWDVPLSEIEHRNTYRGEMKLGQQPSPSEYIRFTNSTVGRQVGDQRSAAILIDFVEVSAPVYDHWPPMTHRSVFLEADIPEDETAYAKAIVTEFIARAFRRKASEQEIHRKLQLFKRLRPSSSDFQEAVVEVLATVLTSPKFLYVLPGKADVRPASQDSRLSQYELATRLSLFLWCSLPDESLLQLASEGRLNEVGMLEQQVERLLADPKATRFAKHFVTQWLKMQPLEFLVPTRGDDGLDEALLESIKQEPISLFADMLERDSNILDFIQADYLVVNARLAEHYGLAGVQGNHFRRVSLPVDRNRGGVLTQAGLLTMNSDGEHSHPVKRGVWLLTNLLNDPPPPPPPAVPEIDLTDPAIAKMSLKERIEDHRNHAACMSCHNKIDPWGIAFENYDALGRWRDEISGKTVDATSMLPGGARLDGVAGVKEQLIGNRREQFLRATVEKLASFALGRQLAFGDRAEITEIVRRVEESGSGLKTAVMCLVTSELFQAK